MQSSLAMMIDPTDTPITQPVPNPIQHLVVVVDDDVFERMGAADMFIGAGYRVIEAGSADEALRIFDATIGIRVLFTDVTMPGLMDGADLACCVDERWPLVGIIIASGRRRPAILPARTLFHDKPYQPIDVLRQAKAMTAVPA
jgi:CheY-like chemotaxis protein